MRSFSSKILLLGEYGLLLGSKGLALPYPAYSGKFSSILSDAPDIEKLHHSNRQLRLLSEFLTTAGLDYLDITSFEFEIKEGLCFDSNIPQGYGAGSSGALTAALFDRYAVEGAKTVSLVDIRKMLAGIEQYFHGTSSGLDPLVSYVNCPVSIEPDGRITLHERPELLPGKRVLPDQPGLPDAPRLFLLDTLIHARTGNLVQQFLQQSKVSNYRKLLEEIYLPVTGEAIDAYLAGNKKSFEASFSTISTFQFNHFKAMIPSTIAPHFSNGLETGDYMLKLCGSGGGGFMLGCALNCDTAENHFKRSGLPLIWL